MLQILHFGDSLQYIIVNSIKLFSLVYQKYCI